MNKKIICEVSQPFCPFHVFRFQPFCPFCPFHVFGSRQLKVPMSCFIPFVFEEEKKIVKRSNLTQRSKIETK
jgi:hypothetical protein